jgi:RHS repeat-associated protein
MRKYFGASLIPVVLIGLMMAPPRARRSPSQMAASAQPNADSETAVRGDSKTLLPDGHWLILGGETSKGVLGTASLQDPATGAVTPLTSSLLHSRAWHTATLLPNGTVFIFGGLGSDGRVVVLSETFDPATKQFQAVDAIGLNPRAHHTATVLTDGSVLFAGGISEGGEVLSLVDSWNSTTSTGTALFRELLTARRDHTATLLPDGEVLFWSGLGRNGTTIPYGEVYDPRTATFRIETTPFQASTAPPSVEESIPPDGSEDVPVNVVLSLRFSKPLQVTAVNATTVTLAGPSGQVSANVVPTEDGMLAFVTPDSPLLAGTSYSLSLSGLTDVSGDSLPQTTINFATVGSGVTAGSGTQGNGTGSSGGQGGDSQAQNLPPLQAPPGVTALAGQSLKLNGSPLEELTIQDEDSGLKTKTDETGRFLLSPLSAGHHVLFVDGQTATRRDQVYGTYEIGVDIAASKTNALNYKIWMTPLDEIHAVRIPSPTINDMVIGNPTLPGLELHIPKGTVITDHYGKVVTEISITPIPLTQPPFPLPRGVPVPIYFTIQPGAAYLTTNSGTGPQGAQLYYPNSQHFPVGVAFDFWNYDPDVKGWYVYGQGKVAPDGKQVIPDPGVRIYEFTGAMVGSPGFGPPTGPAPSGNGPLPPGMPPGSPSTPHAAGDPVDFGTGLFNYVKTDLVLPDVLPISLTRSYRPGDSMSRPFGIGASHPFEMFLVGDASAYSYAELILPDGGRVRFNRISPGTAPSTAVYTHSSTTTGFYGSLMAWNGNGWNLTLKNGTVYVFPDGFNAQNPRQCALIGIKDRYGNTVNMTRDGNHNLTQITTPNGRWIQFTYDGSNRITQAQDNIGRTIGYAYDSSGRLSTVTDAKGGTTIFTYDSNNNMLTITDPKGITYLTNQYDSNNRVVAQTMADGSTYRFAYTLAGNSTQTHFVTLGKSYTGAGPGIDILGFRNCQGCAEGYTPVISQTDITDQRGYVRRIVFNQSGYAATETYAVGQPEEQTTTYQYYPDNLLKSVTDTLGRTTTYMYDVNSNVTQVSRLSGTPAAITSTTSYEYDFNQPLSVTDPLGHTTSFDYDSNGNLLTVTDPVSDQSSFTYNAAGQILTATDGLSNKTTFAYDSGDLVSITDPLNRTTTRYLDGAGRLITQTNPLGQTTRTDYDALNEITKVTDPVSNTTTFAYDGNGNLLSVTDANSRSTTYAYDSMDRLSTRTDPLLSVEQYHYDAAGNLLQFTDRRGIITTYTYDSLNRRTFAGFGTAVGTPNTYDNSITYGYDAGNRPTSVIDSVSGKIIPQFDNLDRLISEQTPQGTVSYTYDLAGRRTQMTVAGQSAVNYSYDNANRLIQIAQGSSTVSFAYDGGNRRTSLSLPNGIVMSYTYDNASELTGISYTNGSTNLGSLTYGYDLAGRRTSMGGSLAQTALPLPVNEAEYNAGNQLTEWGTASLYYDSNGNMTSDGMNSYAWNSRNQLASMNFSADSFQYDAYGRRTSKTISSTTTNFLYDGVNIVQELSGTTPTANLLTGGIDEIFIRTESSGTANFLTDALGSTLALTNSSGSTLAQYAYEPFGNTFVTSGSSTNTYEYTGRENDGTGLYFNRARYYNPSLQRFVSEDPIEFLGGSSNLYPYASNSPIYITDPSGRCPMCVVAIAGGVIGGAVAGYEAYKSGASGWNVAAAAAGGAGAGILAGLTGGAVGYVAATEFGAGAVAAGAWGGAAGGAVSGFLGGEVNAANGSGATQTQVLVQTAEGAVAGAVAGAAGSAMSPTVQGGSNFDQWHSPATWGPRAWKLYVESAWSAAVCLASKKC